MFRLARSSDPRPEAVAELRAGGAVLVDVRDDHEWVAGHAPDAHHIPLHSLDRQLAQLSGRTILTICRSGMRSKKAARALSAAGVDAHSVAGGMAAWSAAGLPVVRADGSSGVVL